MKKMLTLAILFAILMKINLFAQISDNFSDGEISTYPTWIGDTSDFIVNDDLMLQLNASQAGTSSIGFSIDNMNAWEEDIEWSFRIKMAFSPSANNYGRFYLLADTDQLKSAHLSGFYLQFGENLNNDAIELVYTEKGQNRTVFRGPDGMIASNFDLNVKIIKSRDNQWQLWVDEEKIGRYHLFAQDTVQRHSDAHYCGLLCKYSASNMNKFYFDDIYCGYPTIDSIRPYVSKISGSEDFQTVSILFSELVNESAIDVSHYQLSDSNFHVMSCEYDISNFNQVNLTIYPLLENGKFYNLEISGIKDLADNQMTDTILSFYCYKTKRNDIVINEIMADPSPSIGLPDAEYIELYNKSNYDLLLKQWTLQIGKTTKPLPDISIRSSEYIIITSEANKEALANYANRIYTLSSLQLTDAGQELILFNNHDEVIHYVKYKDNWHLNSIKQEGGWSLEMIDFNNPCEGAGNWNSSEDPTGGTPGRRNSIAGVNPDYREPYMESVTQLDSNQIRVFFSEPILYQENSTVFSADHDLEITNIQSTQANASSLDISFNHALATGMIYQLCIIDSLCDCTGTSATTGQSILFGKDEYPLINNLIINEILNNPPNDEDADYIEIYNNSDFIIDLKKIKIGSGGYDFPDKSVIAVSRGYQLFPKTMVALCKNKNLTLEHYQPLFSQNLLQCDSLPSYPNTSGVVHITDLSLRTINRFAYDEDMHYSLLLSTDGVALERINYDGQTQNPDNWKSASAQVNYGTPGYKNSQFSESISSEKELTVQPEIISPDNDGYDDYALIAFHFTDLENRISICICNREGRKCKQLANNEFCGNEGQYLWDGTDDEGKKISPGLYIVKMTYWNQHGKRGGKQCVIAVR